MDPKQQKNIYIVAGIVLLVIAGWLIVKSPGSKEEETSVEETLVQETPMTEMVEEEKGMTLAQQQQARIKIDEVLQDGNTESTVLKDVSGGQAYGTAYRLNQNGVFYHKAVLKDLPGLEKGYFLEGWLVDPSGSYFSTGRVIPEGTQGVLYYQADKDQSDYNKVVISLEPEDNNPAPAKHLLGGEF
jgi:hypothetical protein